MNRLRELREEAVLTLHELAEKSGVSEDTINKIELGHRVGRPSTLRKLAQALNTTPQVLRMPPQQRELSLPKAPAPSPSLRLILAGNLTSEELHGHVAALDVTDARALLDELTAEQDRLLPLIPQPKATWTTQDRENFHRFTWINRGLAVVLARLASEIEALA